MHCTHGRRDYANSIPCRCGVHFTQGTPVPAMRTGTSSHSEQILQMPGLPLVCSSQHTILACFHACNARHAMPSCSAAPGVLDLVSLPVSAVPHVLELVAGSACHLIIPPGPLHRAYIDMLLTQALGCRSLHACGETSG